MAKNTLSSGVLSTQIPFVELKADTTAADLALPLLDFLANVGPESIGILIWEVLLHYVPIIYRDASGMHGEIPSHCDTLLDCLGYVMFNGDPKKGLAELQANSLPQQMCGRVFRSGESTYICLDCGMDNTCVLCSQCFLHSAHRKHRYRMAASGGSGCCDCGDEEAWKNDAHCSLHEAVEGPDRSDIALEPRQDAAAHAVLGQCLRYCVQVLTWDDGIAPSWCKSEELCLLLYNDEIHTFDEIIHLLKAESTLGVSSDVAGSLATIVDRDGRLPVMKGPLEKCVPIMAAMLAISKSHTKSKVILKTFSHKLVCHQIFAISLLGWLEMLSKGCGSLQRVMRDCVLTGTVYQPSGEGSSDSGGDCGSDSRTDDSVGDSGSDSRTDNSVLIIDHIWSIGNVLWKVSRCEFQSFIMSLMTTDTHQKVDFAIKFMEHYNTIQVQFLEDDHEHSMSMASLSVQFFTVPTVAHALLDHHDAFHVVTKLVRDQLEPAVDKASSLVDMSAHPRIVDMQRFLFVIEDIRYFMNHQPLPWTDERRAWFMRGFQNIVHIFLWMEGMESFMRKTDTHVKYEREWEEGFDLVLRFNGVVRSLLNWIRSDETLFAQCVEHITGRLIEQESFQEAIHKTVEIRKTKPNGPQQTVKGDVLTGVVSVHWPLRRLLARILSIPSAPHLEDIFTQNMAKLPLTVPVNLAVVRPQMWAQCLLESPLRTFIASQQVLTGLWKRNGLSLYSQMMHYVSVACAMGDADLALMQECACILETEIFVATLLARVSFSPPEFTKTMTTEMKMTNMEIFLTILLNILGERYDNGVSDVTERDCIERELAHVLFLGPVTHSEAIQRGLTSPTQFLGCNDKDQRLVDSVLKSIATRSTPRAGHAAEFQLKPEYLSMCTPFFYHYSKKAQSQAHVRAREHKDHVGLPHLPALNARFQPLLRLVSSPLLHRMLAYMLMQCCDPSATGWSAHHIQQLVYLIGLMCTEEDCYLKGVGGRVPADVPVSFMKAATEETLSSSSTILQLLGRLLERDQSADCRPLLRHVIELLAAYHASQQPAPGAACSTEGEAEAAATPAAEDSAASDADAEKARRKKKAAEQRAKAMERMQELQKTFMKSTAAAAAASLSTSPADKAVQRSDSVDGGEPSAMEEEDSAKRVTCILCQEDEEVTEHAASMVMAGYCCKSRVIGTSQLMTEDVSHNFDALLCPSSVPMGVHFSSCGHIMHSKCHTEWLLSESHRRRRRNSPEIFRCPMCNNCSNIALPLFPAAPFVPASRAIDLSSSLSSLASTVSFLLARRAARIRQDSTSSAEGNSDKLKRQGPVSPMKTVTSMCRSITDMLRRGRRSIAGAESSETNQESPQVAGLKEFCNRLWQGIGADNGTSDQVDVVGASLAYDIMVLERVLQLEGRSVFGELSSRVDLPYEALLTLGFLVRKEFSDDPLQLSSSELRLLSVLASGLFSPGTVDESLLEKVDTNIFHLEPFHLIVNLSLLLSSVAEPIAKAVQEGTGDQKEQQAQEQQAAGGPSDSGLACPMNRTECTLTSLWVAVALHVVQILALATPDEVFKRSASDSSDELPKACLLTVWEALRTRNLLKNWSTVDDKRPVTEAQLVAHVEEAVVPLLNRAALFLRWQGCPMPASARCPETYSTLAKFLELPEDISSLLESMFGCGEVLARWLDSLEAVEAELEASVGNCPAKVAKTSLSNICIPTVRGLVDLPHDYSDFIQRVSTLECPQAAQGGLMNKLVEHPAMCLICGEFLCSMTYCCRKDPRLGSLTYHSKLCGGGIGIFLVIWDCKVIILCPPSGMLQGIPYVDEYGEPASASHGSRTINPLYLDKARYSELQQQWQQHGFIQKALAYNEHQGQQFFPNVWHDM